MAVLSPSFLFGVVALIYLSSFVFFAIVRIATGVSIQRFGYFSLRRIAYTPRDGVRIDLRGLALRLHRPTFARPTYISLRLSEFRITFDPVARHVGKASRSAPSSPKLAQEEPTEDETYEQPFEHNDTWKKLTQLKETIKTLHDKIQWLSIVDLEMTDVRAVVPGVGEIQIGSVTAAIDTRRSTVDRNRLFRHKKEPDQDKRPAEWMFVVKGILFIPDGSQALEILDIFTLNVHGLLYKEIAGLRDVSISLKIGRINIPYDEIVECRLALERLLRDSGAASSRASKQGISFKDVVDELDQPGSREDSIVRTVTESREFMASLLRGIQEIQLGVSYVGFTKKVEGVQPNGRPVYANISMNEIGVDLFRLDQKSPAHRMYFSPGDVAHQALIAAISLAVGIDDGFGKSERILYVPMATSTIKTTLPSRSISVHKQEDAAERNANMLFANFAVTSPSIDVGLKHIAVVLALLKSRRQKASARLSKRGSQQRLISRLLPKANVRFSIQEPVARVVLPPSDKALRTTDEYDLLISSISSISLGVESSHSSGGELHYALTSTLSITSEELYYQTAQGARHNLLQVETLGLKLQLAATPEISAVVVGSLDNVFAHLVRPEIGKGIYKILQQVRTEPTPSNESNVQIKKPSFLRRLPPWLVHLQIRGSNFGIEVAGVDEDISEHLRGLALQLHAWNVDYKLQKSVSTRSYRPRSEISGYTSPDEAILNSPYVEARKNAGLSTDGRRLSINANGFEGFIVEGIDAREPHSFLSIPRAEVSFATSSDAQGKMFLVHAHTKAFYLSYSLYRFYAVGIAVSVLRKAFFGKRPTESATPNMSTAVNAPNKAKPTLIVPAEAVTLDFRAPLIQIKATMPSDPPMMLQIYGLDFTRTRWSNPYVRAQLVRLYAEAPRIKNVWARIVSLKSARVDFRRATKIIGKEAILDRSIDIETDFVRLAVPHQLVIYKVMDNFVNTIKSTEQLIHRFKTETNDYVLQKQPEGPKRLPKLNLRSRTLVFEIEDSPFDWKLDLIYRVGVKEQKQRLAREEAYNLKIKKLREQEYQKRDQARGRQGIRKPRGRSAGHSLHAEADAEDEIKLQGSRGRRRSSWGHGHDERYMHYDADAGCVLTGEAKITADEAWLNLQQYNAASWKKRISFAMKNQSSSIRDYRRALWGDDDLPEDAEEPESIIAIPSRPALMMAVISHVNLTIDKPSFPIDDYPKFLHDIGKGMPYDTQYSLLVPMSIDLKMGESKISLRNYPLPLLHVPALKSGQPARLPSWSLKTDFVIAEEFRDSESIRHVKVEIVPPSKITEPPEVEGGFAIDVRRTVSPVKTYSNIDVVVNTKNPTTFTWGTAYQPAIQDMMQIIESFTKPTPDPSEKVGFWDKIRLSFHSRARIAWTGDGDVHFKLKGTRDPYSITGIGSGFIWCFRDGVRWDIHQTDEPKEFMSVSCGEYVWAIPDYSEQARYTDFSGKDNDSVYSGRSVKMRREFKKVIMKLSGNVRWLAGLVFERESAEKIRSFEFCKHFEVTTKTPEAAQKYMPNYDAFRSFRSQYIHLSIAVIAPVKRDWSVKNLKPSTGYNTAHLSPRFFTHFFAWWSTFQGSLMLPVRQGPLFPGVEKSSKKFGRHLATIKYNLLLSPLFLAHIYKHKDADEYNDDITRATGLKVKLDSFMLDMHQRRETFATQKKAKGKSGMTSGMKINQAQLDFVNADFRAVSSTISGTSPETIRNVTEDDLALLHLQSSPIKDTSGFTIPDNDLTWVDMDDFVELDWMLPAEKHPDVKIMPLAFSPRFTYFRQTEHNGTVAGDATRSSQFGDESTHFCVMSQDNDPKHVQRDLVQERHTIVNEQIRELEITIKAQEQKMTHDAPDGDAMKKDIEELRKQADALRQKRAFMDKLLAELGSATQNRRRNTSVGAESAVQSLSELAVEAEVERKESRLDPRITDYASDFNNRFTVHNIQLKWNNSLRDIILRYVHQVSQRRGFTYYTTRSAVKFILDILEEQKRKGRQTPSEPDTAETRTPRDSSKDFANGNVSDELRDRIEELVNDAKNFVHADDDQDDGETRNGGTRSNAKGKDVAEEFTAVNSYHVRLIAPQIQLQSEKNPKSVLLVTARGMQLKVIQIMDKNRISDDISGLVQRRFLIDMDGVQFFVTNQKDVSRFLSYYARLRYGAPEGKIWPPWAPLEVNFDSRLSPFGWFRVVQETSINLRYEKYNNLRLKYNNEVMEYDEQSRSQAQTNHDAEKGIDQISVEFPQVKAICDSSQYFSMFVIVSDLLLYSEPLEKKRNERLEKIMLAADFSDLAGTPETVEGLQDRIRQLEEIRDYFQLHSNRLEKQGWADRLAIERDLSICEEELFFMMKAITSSQRKIEDRSARETNGLMRWNISADQIVWHLVRDQGEPLAEFQLRNAMFDRTDNSDGSNNNMLEIGQIFGLNLMADAIYPQMIAPYDARGIEAAYRRIQDGDITMLKVNWHMLEAIAGIPVLSHFEINLFPLKVQLEQTAGKKLFEYVFPPGNSESGTAQSPFLAKHRPGMLDDDDSDVDLAIPASPASIDGHSFEPDTRAGSMELRLRPTLNLSDMASRPTTSHSDSGFRKKDHTVRKLSPFHGRERERSTSRSRASVKSNSTRSSSKMAGNDDLTMSSKVTRDDSNSNLSTLGSKTSERSNRFGLRRSHTTKSSGVDKEKPSDDLTEMMSRASNYMTLAYVKIPSVILCLSYKGKNDRNFVDVHDFVFTMPTIEYRNKTWSNMDLVLRLKKDVIKALISHTGAIIGNKFSHHRPTKHQQNRLRELATSSTLLPNTNNIASTLVRTATTFKHRSIDKTIRRGSHSEMTHEEETIKEESVDSESAYTVSAGRAQDLPKMTINGRTFNVSSPTNGDSSRPTSSTLDGESSSAFERPSTRPGTRESSAEPQRKTPRSVHSVEAEQGQDDDASSAKRGRKSNMLNLGRKLLGSAK